MISLMSIEFQQRAANSHLTSNFAGPMTELRHERSLCFPSRRP
jgi:hypothetical protein